MHVALAVRPTQEDRTAGGETEKGISVRPNWKLIGFLLEKRKQKVPCLLLGAGHGYGFLLVYCYLPNFQEKKSKHLKNKRPLREKKQAWAM